MISRDSPASHPAVPGGKAEHHYRHMNAIVRRTLVVGSCLGLFPLQAQEAEQVEGTGTVSPDSSSEVSIVGELPDGTPPPPPEPKPRLVFEPDDIVASRTKDLGERQVTFQKVAPIELPPMAEPAPAVEGIADQDSSDRLGDYKERRFVFLGASAYVAADAPDRPRSYVRYWPTPGGKPVGLWINANLLWMTGFAEFETDETLYSLLMAISRVDLQRQAEIATRSGQEYQAPEVPEFPDETKASFVVVEGNPTEEELAPIQAMVDLYNSDKERLRIAYEGRVAAAEERARELRENPPAKKNLLIRYWRLDQAGQAGATPQPAVIR